MSNDFINIVKPFALLQTVSWSIILGGGTMATMAKMVLKSKIRWIKIAIFRHSSFRNPLVQVLQNCVPILDHNIQIKYTA